MRDIPVPGHEDAVGGDGQPLAPLAVPPGPLWKGTRGHSPHLDS